MPADDTARATGPRDAAPDRPQTRDRVVQQHRDRRRKEPAAAPIEADGEAGNTSGRHGGDPLPRDGMGRPRDPVAEAPERDPADIPAGPGDAGAQGAPRTLPEALQRDRGGWGRVLAVLGAGLLAALIIALLA